MLRKPSWVNIAPPAIPPSPPGRGRGVTADPDRPGAARLRDQLGGSLRVPAHWHTGASGRARPIGWGRGGRGTCLLGIASARGDQCAEQDHQDKTHQQGAKTSAPLRGRRLRQEPEGRCCVRPAIRESSRGRHGTTPWAWCAVLQLLHGDRETAAGSADAASDARTGKGNTGDSRGGQNRNGGCCRFPRILSPSGASD